MPGAAKATDGFIHVEMNVVLADDGLHRLPIACGRTDRAAARLHRFGKKGRNRIRPGLQHGLFKLRPQAGREFFFALAILRI